MPCLHIYVQILQTCVHEISILLLMKIRSKTISFASRKKKETRKTEFLLEKEINILSDKVPEGDPDSVDLLNAKQADLIDLRKAKMEGVLIKSKSRWLEDGEKPSKYFLKFTKA